VIAILIGGAIGKGVIQSFYNSESNGDFDKSLMKVSSQLNENLPMMIDRETRLENTMGGPGKKFTYYYRLVNYEAEEIDLAEFNRNVATTVRRNAINNKQLKLMFKKGVTVIYNYNGKNGKFIADIRITPSEAGY
jgi:hypothetical protein